MPPKELEEITKNRNSISQNIGLGRYDEVFFFFYKNNCNYFILKGNKSLHQIHWANKKILWNQSSCLLFSFEQSGTIKQSIIIIKVSHLSYKDCWGILWSWVNLFEGFRWLFEYFWLQTHFCNHSHAKPCKPVFYSIVWALYIIATKKWRSMISLSNFLKMFSIWGIFLFLSFIFLIFFHKLLERKLNPTISQRSEFAKCLWLAVWESYVGMKKVKKTGLKLWSWFQRNMAKRIF